MRFKFAAATPAGVVLKLNGLSKASRVSKMAMSPSLATAAGLMAGCHRLDRKSTRLNSSHGSSSYAGFCLKKKKHAEYDKHEAVAGRQRGREQHLRHSISLWIAQQTGWTNRDQCSDSSKARDYTERGGTVA